MPLVDLEPAPRFCVNCKRPNAAHSGTRCMPWNGTYFKLPTLANLRVGNVLFYEGNRENIPWTVVAVDSGEAELVAATGAQATVTSQSLVSWKRLVYATRSDPL